MNDDRAGEPHEIIDLTAEERAAVIRTEAAVVEDGVPKTDEERTRVLEAVLFVATEPLPTVLLSRLLEVDLQTGERLLTGLSASYEQRRSGLALREVAGGWRLSTHPAAAGMVERFVLSSKHSRLTKASLETLAIVAYKQPVTRHQISAIRGVNSDSVLRALADRGLVGEVGREEGPGHPVLYGTTPDFLERTGLKSVADLPSLGPFLDEAVPGNQVRRGPVGEQDPAVVGDESGEPEREEPGEPGPDAPPEPAETETEGVPAEPEPEEDPGAPESPGSPDPDRGSGEESSPDPDRSGG
ncbi:MAG: SMC-Scp complex subunit ScpB [Actinomycetota bacterium]